MSEIFYAEVADFYAAVEEAEDPALRGRPIVVGGDPRKRGRIQSANAPARRAGAALGMRVSEALSRCADAVARRTDMKRYREASEALRLCLSRRVAALETAALGAYYFRAADVRAGEAAGRPASRLGELLCREVEETFELRLRVGVAPAKFLAKLAAEEAGEGGVRVVDPGSENAFLAPLGVERLPGVGPRTRTTLADLGIATVAQLLDLEPATLERALGNHGLRILDYARGVDDAPVRPVRHALSLSAEYTFPEPQVDRDALRERLQQLARAVSEKLARQQLQATCVGLKVHFADATVENRSRTVSRSLGSANAIYRVALRLLERTHAETRPVRRVGLSVSKMLRESAGDRQMELFPEAD